MVLDAVDKLTTVSTGCGARWAVDNCGKSHSGYRMAMSRIQSDGPRLVTEGLTPSGTSGKELPTW